MIVGESFSFYSLFSPKMIFAVLERLSCSFSLYLRKKVGNTSDLHVHQLVCLHCRKDAEDEQVGKFEENSRLIDLFVYLSDGLMVMCLFRKISFGV